MNDCQIEENKLRRQLNSLVTVAGSTLPHCQLAFNSKPHFLTQKLYYYTHHPYRLVRKQTQFSSLTVAQWRVTIGLYVLSHDSLSPLPIGCRDSLPDEAKKIRDNIGRANINSISNEKDIMKKYKYYLILSIKFFCQSLPTSFSKTHSTSVPMRFKNDQFPDIWNIYITQ